MVQNLIASVSVLVALAGFALSYQGHRDKQKQRGQTQASMLDIRMKIDRSPLHDGWAVPQVVVANLSNRPLQALRVLYHDDVLAETPVLATGDMSVALPPLERTMPTGLLLGHVAVEFSDSAGTRWRREGYGSLQRGSRSKGLDRWKWGAPESPLVATAPPDLERSSMPPGPPSGPVASAPAPHDEVGHGAPQRSRRRTLRLCHVPPVVVALLSVGLLGVAAVLFLAK
ncbi:hypothetical protein [Streptomyces sp. NPDC058964]|uniref:hypothetical protein n=1 Tax=Streptomyces sp. NPDC058964 TaxID=3346681 RepID=UPI0036D02C58